MTSMIFLQAFVGSSLYRYPSPVRSMELQVAPFQRDSFLLEFFGASMLSSGSVASN